MVNKTVGTGGDFANWKEALDWASANDPLTDNWTFTQISDVVEDGNYSDSIDCGIWTFTMTSNSKPAGNPNAGWKIDSKLYYRIIGNTGGLVIDGLYFYSSTAQMADKAYIASNGAGKTTVKNCLIIGGGSSNEHGISVGNIEAANCDIFGCKIFNCGSYGIGHISAAGGGSVGTHKVENCTIFDCGINADPSYRAGIGNFLTAGWTIKNTVSCHTASHLSGRSDWGSSLGTVTNCADSDGTLTSGTLTKNNIVPANEFQSLVSTNAKFLFLKNTKYWAWQYGSANLGPNGAVPSLSSTDIAGVAYLDANGKYPIGCHAPLAVYETATFMSVLKVMKDNEFEDDIDDGSYDAEFATLVPFTREAYVVGNATL